MFSLQTKLDPPAAVPVSVSALARAPFGIKQEASEAMAASARRIAKDAASAAQPHPSGFWKGLGSPRYRVLKSSLLSISVGTPGGEVGKAEAISEFAAKAGSGSVRNGRRHAPRPDLPRTLTRIYGRPGGSGGGRILWRAYDDGEDAYVRDMEEAVGRFAAKLQNEVNR